MSDSDAKYRQVAVRVAASATEAERVALAKWAEGLIAIRSSNAGALVKGKEAVQLTLRSEVVWPLVKMLGKELKRVGWNERGYKSRGLLVGAGLGLVLFGGQGAGIAALGTAIGVPLWIVLGAGGAFVGTLLEEVRRLGKSPEREASVKTSYTVIDGDKKSGDEEPPHVK